AEAERRLKVALLASDVLMSAAVPDHARVSAVLDSVASAAAGADPNNPFTIEYQYRRLQLAQKRGDHDAIQRAARFIGEHGAGTPYELPALVIVARDADAAVQAASAT